MLTETEPVRYRTVINDAACLPWEGMPEIRPPTLIGLVDFLKTCPGWDWKRLVPGTGFDNGHGRFLVDYGDRAQFLLPSAITENDEVWFRKEIECPMIRAQKRKILWGI
jgi:hypothetical protein